MENPFARRTAATFIGIVLICAPALVSAQNVSGPTSQTLGNLQMQIQTLLTQIATIKQQIEGIMMQSSSTAAWMNASSTPPQSPPQMPWNNPGMASSTPSAHPSGGMGCPMIDQDLSVGSSGSDVSQLQQFLSELPGNLFPGGDVTGYFGSVTQRALGEFQMQFGIASSSTGGVGPLTRAFFMNGCPMTGTDMGSSTSMMHPMMPWMGSGTSTSPSHPMQPPMRPSMASTTAMWSQSTSSQPYWMTFAPPSQNPQQQQPAGTGWHGSVPPWQPNQ